MLNAGRWYFYQKIIHIMKTHLFLIIAFLLMTDFVSAQDNKASASLTAAIYEEEVTGNLDKAVELYLDILKKYPNDRPVAAKALYHLGLVNEKMGKQKANEYFTRLVNSYPDQTELVALAKTKLAALAGAAGTSGSSTLAVRRVWVEAHVPGNVSPDGSFVSFSDMSSNLAIHDLATGQNRRLTEEGSLNGPEGCEEYTVPSPDSRSIAYAWRSSTRDLRVIGIDGSKLRILKSAGNGVHHFIPLAWSPDGKHILAEFVKTDGTCDMTLVAISDGSAKLLKTIGKESISGCGVLARRAVYCLVYHGGLIAV